MSCPCCSGKPYIACCKRYHDGLHPPDALALMRSRYSAYAKGLVEYIMDTTHRENSAFTKDRFKWMLSLTDFCEGTEFTGLDIIDSVDGEVEAYVTFKAHLKQNGVDASFTEKSRFVKENGHWLYHSGEIKASHP